MRYTPVYWGVGMTRILLAMYSTFAVIFGPTIPSIAQQPKSVIHISYDRVREVLEAGIKPMGGFDALQDIEDVTRELSGVRTDEGQGMWPVVPHVSNVRGKLGSDLDALLTRHSKDGYSGSVLVAIKGEIILHKGYGLADRERGIRNTWQMLYCSARLCRL
jgi:hypothetical protein